ncbi:FecR family protein [Cyclobacterium plantarum]|uniref:DUF4974 domain-containing protein n=1 Tax=Cyclobacterium plantarum TaxID=2716263 RepID=A0ABX0H4U7_9BACT|nr:FecR domain-containing protein [Cyclobacterium plantarum]NHE56532.1 DUF4974 domain-containing protein [Cyclobacterium plantarum]
MRIKRIKEILRNYRFGRTSAREDQIIDQWYDSLNNRKKNFTKEELSSIGQSILKRINGKIDAKEYAKYAARPKRKGVIPIGYTYILRIAAVLILGVITVSLLVNDHSKLKNDTISHLDVKVNEVHLSDGSIVWLKSDSKLYYPDEFDRDSREVHLEGEAFFDVVKDKNRPFIIYSKDMVTKVLGTSFNVRDYEEESEKAVEVLTGSVRVSLSREDGSRENVVLKSREKVSFNKAAPSGKGIKKNDSPVFVPEATRELKFEEAPIQEIIDKLNQVHEVDIRIKNKALYGCRITANLTYETLDVCLEIISRALNAKYYQIEDQIFIDGKGCLN